MGGGGAPAAGHSAADRACGRTGRRLVRCSPPGTWPSAGWLQSAHHCLSAIVVLPVSCWCCARWHGRDRTTSRPCHRALLDTLRQDAGGALGVRRWNNG